MSFAESIANVCVGYVLAVASQLAVLPWFGVHHLSMSENLLVGGIFTLVSIVRSYTLRRLFDSIQARMAGR